MASGIEFLVKDLDSAVRQVTDDATGESARVEALQAATKLFSKLKKPKDALLKHAYSVYHPFPTLEAYLIKHLIYNICIRLNWRSPDYAFHALRERTDSDKGACKQSPVRQDIDQYIANKMFE